MGNDSPPPPPPPFGMIQKETKISKPNSFSFMCRDFPVGHFLKSFSRKMTRSCVLNEHRNPKKKKTFIIEKSIAIDVA
jgi:hypothetical protein